MFLLAPFAALVVAQTAAMEAMEPTEATEVVILKHP